MAADSEHLRETIAQRGTILLGYVCAVTAATLAFCAGAVPDLVYQQWQSSDLLSGRLWNFATLSMIMGAFFWFIAFFTTLLPFAAVYLVARWLGIRSVFYYLLCGAMTGLILTPVALFIGDALLGSDEAPNLLQEWGHAAPQFMVYGACGALAFWYVAARRIGVSIRAVSGQS